MAKEQQNPNILPENPATVPFFLLKQHHREVLQHTANGFKTPEIRSIMGISNGTIERYRKEIGWIGLAPSRRANGLQNAPGILLALIQDGINYGYVTHKLQSDEEVVISKPQELILRNFLNDTTISEMTIEMSPDIQKIFDKEHRSLIEKFGTTTNFHTVARFTELKRRGLLKVESPKKK